MSKDMIVINPFFFRFTVVENLEFFWWEDDHMQPHKADRLFLASPKHIPHIAR